jgi:hypothetical protein
MELADPDFTSRQAGKFEWLGVKVDGNGGQ